MSAIKIHDTWIMFLHWSQLTSADDQDGEFFYYGAWAGRFFIYLGPVSSKHDGER